MTANQILELQIACKASPLLIAHHKVVAEVAERIAKELLGLNIIVDLPRVRSMAVVHDIGKIRVREELEQSGSLHEQVGYKFTLEKGIPEAVSSVCRLPGALRLDGTRGVDCDSGRQAVERKASGGLRK